MQITELHIIGITENICNMMREQSDWIMRLDIVEKEDKLEVIRVTNLLKNKSFSGYNHR